MAWMSFREGSKNICSTNENTNLLDPTREKPHEHTYGGATTTRPNKRKKGEPKTTVKKKIPSISEEGNNRRIEILEKLISYHPLHIQFAD